MKIVILDGSDASDTLGQRIVSATRAHFAAANHDVHTFVLRDRRIGNCAGDFFCWVRTPGQCMVADDNRVIAAAIATADLLVYCTPITFGGYSATLKQAVDHQIQNISPFFVKLNGETHHAKRYDRYADFLVIGWQSEPDPHSEAIFRHLVWRNHLNFYAQTWHCEVVTGNPSATALTAQIALASDRMARGESDPMPALPPLPDLEGRHAPPRNALLLVGSPRNRKSTSHAIGSYLLEQLRAYGVETDTIAIYPSLRQPTRMQLLLDRIDAADLIVLAFPIYIDSLPAPVITLLERLTAHRAAHPDVGGQFVALANCGFPEAQHTTNALAICAVFARAAGFIWQGSLGLGAGEGLVHGTPLDEMDGRVIPLKRALKLAARALAQGEPIPAAAQRLINRPTIPPWLYRFVGTIGWQQQARRWRAQKMLDRKPYLS